MVLQQRIRQATKKNNKKCWTHYVYPDTCPEKPRDRNNEKQKKKTKKKEKAYAVPGSASSAAAATSLLQEYNSRPCLVSIDIVMIERYVTERINYAVQNLNYDLYLADKKKKKNLNCKDIES